ncbi:MAG: hypothetical protein RLZZ450_4390 [Pseudomonadota bacterium]|jgi:predicted nucleotidyltransferase
MPSIYALSESLRHALEPFDAVRVAYLFGSRAMGKAREDSDLDLALSLDPSVAKRASLLLDLLDALARKLGPLGERADLVDLGRSSSRAYARYPGGRRLCSIDSKVAHLLDMGCASP